MDEFDNWDDDPLDDMDFDLDFDTPQDKSRIKSFMRGFLGGAKESIFTKETLQLALPSSFKNTFQAASAINAKRRELEDEFKKANAETVQDLQYLVGRGLTKYREKLPNRIASGLDSFVDRDFSSWESKGSYDSLDRLENVDEEDINYSMQETVDAVDRQSGVLAQVGESLIETMGQTSARTLAGLKVNANQLSSVNATLNRIADYQLKVQTRNDAIKIRLLSSMNLLNAKYYKFMEASMHRSIAELKEIKANAGKSDYEKMSHSEYLKSQVRNTMFNSVTKSFGGISDFFSERFGKDARTDNYDQIGTMLGSLRMGMEMSEGMPINYNEMAGQFLAQFLVGQAPYLLQSGSAQQVIGRLKSQFPKQAAQLTNFYKVLTKVGHTGSYAANNLKGLLNSQIGEFAFDEDDMTYEEYVSMLPSGEKPLPKAVWTAKKKGKSVINKGLSKVIEESMDPTGSRVQVRARSIKELVNPTPWTNLEKRTLNEVIPALISQVHLSLEKIRTGDDTLKPITYNYQRSKLVNHNENKAAVRSTLFNKNDFNNQADSVLGIVNAIDKDGTLSSDAKRQLAIRLAKDADTGKFNPYNLANFEGEGVDKKTAEEISKVVRASFGITDEALEDSMQGSYLDRIIKQSKFGTDDGQALANNVSDRMNSLKAWRPDVSSKVDMLRYTGQEQELIRAGLLRYENGNLYFNDKAVDDELANAIKARLDKDSDYNSKYSDQAYSRRASEIKGKTRNIGGLTLGVDTRSEEDIIRELREKDRREKELEEYQKAQSKFAPIEDDGLIDSPTAGGIRSVRNKNVFNFDTEELTKSLNKLTTKLDGFVSSVNPNGSSGLDELAKQVGLGNSTLSRIEQHTDSQVKLLEKISETGIEVNFIKRSKKNGGAGGSLGSDSETIKKSFFDRLKDTNLKDMFNKGVDKVLDHNPLLLGGMLGGLGAIAIDNPKTAMLLGAGAVAGSLYMKMKTMADARFPSDDEDIYVEGQEDPILESRKLRNGDYYDMATKFVIKTWKDVTGTVIDVGGRVIATAKTLGQTLFGPDGRKVILSGLDAIKTAAVKAFNFIDPVTRLKKLGKGFMNRIYQQDVYIVGEEDPVLKGVDFAAGKYFKEKDGELVVLNGWNEIDGPVYDSDQQVLITKEEYESGLRTTSGMKIDSFKKGAGLLGKASKAMLTRFGLKASKAAGMAGRAAVDTFSNDYTPITNSVDRIYNLLVSHWGYTGTEKDILSTLGKGPNNPTDSSETEVAETNAQKVGRALKRRKRLKVGNKGSTDLPFEDKENTGDSDSDDAERFNSLAYKERAKVKDEESKSRGALIRLSEWFTGKDKEKKKEKKPTSFLGMITSGIGLLLAPFSGALSIAGKGFEMMGSFLRFIPSIASGVYGVGKAVVGVLAGLLNGKAAMSAIDATADAAAAMVDRDMSTTGGLDNKKNKGGKATPKAGKSSKPGLLRGLFKTNNRLFGAAFKQAGRSGRVAGSVLRGAGRAAKWAGGLGGGSVGRFAKGMGAAALGGGISMVTSGLRASHSVEPGGIGETLLNGADTIGSILGTVGTIDTMLAMAGSSVSLTGMGMSAMGAVAPILFNPITLGIAAAAGGAYMAYRYYSRGKGAQLALRMAQYGLPEPDNDFAGNIIEIEKELSDFVEISGNTARLSNKAPLESLFHPIVSNITDEQLKKNFYVWFNYRFKPVFLMTHSAIKTAGFESLEKYDEATTSDVYQAAKACHDSVGGFDPHPYTINLTFKQDLELLNKAQTLKKVTDYLDDLKAYASRHGGTTEEIINKGMSKVQSVKAMEEQLKKSEEADNWFSDSEGNLGIWDRRKRRNELEDIKESEAKLPSKIDISDMIPETGLLDPITSMRLAAYGNDKDVPWKCQVVLRLERWCEPYLAMGQKEPEFKLKTEDVYNAFKESFKADGWFDSDRWVEWFNYRFLPVMKTWYAACFKLRNNVPSKTWRSLTATNCFDIGRDLAELKIMRGSNLISIWDVIYSPFSGWENSPPLEAKGADVLKALQVKAKDAKLRDPETEKARSRAASPADTKKVAEKLEGKAGSSSGYVDATKTAIPGISLPNQFTGTDNSYPSPTSYGAGNTAFDKYANTASQIKEPPPLRNVNQKAAEKMLYDVAVSHGLKGKELAMFMAQCAEESGNFTTFVENTKYSPSNMTRIWPKRFPTIQAAQALHKQGEQAVVNSIYGGRNGNRPGTSDGWDYRGRGFIQLTGRNNYALASRTIGDPQIMLHPELVGSDLKMSAEASLGWWLANEKARATAQAGDIRGNTQTVNGGMTNFEKRLSYYNKYVKLVESGNLDKMMTMQGSTAAISDSQPDTSGVNKLLDARAQSMANSDKSTSEAAVSSGVAAETASGASQGGSSGGMGSIPSNIAAPGSSGVPSMATAPSSSGGSDIPTSIARNGDQQSGPAMATATPVEVIAKLPPDLAETNAAMITLLSQINDNLAASNKPSLTKVKI